jgi:hypothetical protein
MYFVTKSHSGARRRAHENQIIMKRFIIPKAKENPAGAGFSLEV